jgi:long-chain fatty acid transport protein
VKFSNSIDFGTIGAGLGIPGASPGQDDGSIKLRASAWSFGFNSGALIEATPSTRFGVAYFYSGSAKLTGSAQFQRSAIGDIISALSGAFSDTTAASTLPFPDHLNFGVIQALSPALDIRAGLTWTRWSSFRDLRIAFANPNQPDTVTVENWRDVYEYALGATYQANAAVKLRAGIAYDTTPIPNAEHRTPRLPDASRLNAALGIGYALSQTTHMDIAYEHVFAGAAPLDVVSASGDRLIGKTRPSGDILAVQLNFRF